MRKFTPALVAIALAAACGSDDGGGEGNTSAASPSAEPGATATDAVSAGEPAVESGANALNVTLRFEPGADLSAVCADAAAVLNERYPVDDGWTVGGGAMEGYSECSLSGAGPFTNVLIDLGGPANNLPSESIAVGGFRAYETYVPSNRQISLTFTAAPVNLLEAGLFGNQ